MRNGDRTLPLRFWLQHPPDRTYVSCFHTELEPGPLSRARVPSGMSWRIVHLEESLWQESRSNKIRRKIQERKARNAVSSRFRSAALKALIAARHRWKARLRARSAMLRR